MRYHRLKTYAGDLTDTSESGESDSIDLGQYRGPGAPGLWIDVFNSDLIQEIETKSGMILSAAEGASAFENFKDARARGLKCCGNLRDFKWRTRRQLTAWSGKVLSAQGDYPWLRLDRESAPVPSTSPSRT